MYLTIREIAKKYNIDTAVGLAEHAMECCSHLLVNNPDISASSIVDLYMVNVSKVNPRLIIEGYVKNCDTPDDDEIEVLKSFAITALARYFAACNKQGYVDWSIDMRMEDVDPGLRSNFMSDWQAVGDVLADFDEDFIKRVAALLPDLQK